MKNVINKIPLSRDISVLLSGNFEVLNNEEWNIYPRKDFHFK